MKTSSPLSLAICLIYFSLPSCLLSQYLRVGISGNIPIGKLGDMNDALQIADSSQKTDLLERLGIDKKIAEAAATAHPAEDLAVKSFRASPGKTFGIVFLPCGTAFLQAVLYVLEDAGANSWHVTDHVAIDCFHQKPAYQILPLTSNEDSILVQHAHGGHGSGMLEDNTILYGLKTGKLRELLSTRDFWSQEDLMDPMDPSSVNEQTSTFLFFPRRIIEETRITAHNGSPLKVERRLWRWSPKKQLFSADPFRTVPQ